MGIISAVSASVVTSRNSRQKKFRQNSTKKDESKVKIKILKKNLEIDMITSN